MVNDRFYNQRFIFPDGSIHEQYIWESDIVNDNINKFPKNDNGEIGIPYYPEEKEINFSVLSKMTTSEIRVDRTKRSKEHFKKEVWETIPKSEKKFFRNRKDLK